MPSRAEADVLTISAYVTPAERSILMVVAGQLGEALCDAEDRLWPVGVKRLPFEDAAPATREPIVVASFLGDVFPLQQSMDAIKATWQARLERWCGVPQRSIVLCSVFRHVDDHRTRPEVVEKIRRLNRLVVELSRQSGAFVADLDRTLSFFGAEALQTDYRLAGERAAEAAAHTIVTSLLSGDLGGAVPAERQANAVRRHGGLFQAAAVIERRRQGRGY